VAAPQTFDFSWCYYPRREVILTRRSNVVYLHSVEERLPCLPEVSAVCVADPLNGPRHGRLWILLVMGLIPFRAGVVSSFRLWSVGGLRSGTVISFLSSRLGVHQSRAEHGHRPSPQGGAYSGNKVPGNSFSVSIVVLSALQLRRLAEGFLRLFLIAIVRAFIVRSALNSAPSEDNLKVRS
jgi:hypothetical protein